MSDMLCTEVRFRSKLTLCSPYPCLFWLYSLSINSHYLLDVHIESTSAYTPRLFSSFLRNNQRFYIAARACNEINESSLFSAFHLSVV